MEYELKIRISYILQGNYFTSTFLSFTTKYL